MQLPANSSFLWQLHKISRNVKNKFHKVVFRLADLSFYERYVFQRPLLLLPGNFSMKFKLRLKFQNQCLLHYSKILINNAPMLDVLKKC